MKFAIVSLVASAVLFSQTLAVPNPQDLPHSVDFQCTYVLCSFLAVKGLN